MMYSKKIILCLALMLLMGNMQAQNFKEWFQQKKTQKRYLIEQIIALHAYLKVAKKGYEIVRIGWKTVEQIREGDLSLHTDYFNSLELANPMVTGYGRAAAALEIQANILSTVSKDRAMLNQNTMLGAKEKQNVLGFYNEILDKSRYQLGHLERIMDNHELEMTDAERLEHIDSVYGAMLRLYQALRVYDSRLQMWMAQMQRNANSNENLQKFHEHEN